jgi:mycofactocin glycosyltransferase
MPAQPPKGSFQLKRGVQLIPAPEGGIILQSEPLRAMKINQAAFNILDRCRTGFQVDPDHIGREQPAAMNFLDTLHQGGLLDWMPLQHQPLPSVSIVIPVYRRPAEIKACLNSLQSLDYPADKLQIIVVDDASLDQTAAVVRQFDVRLIIEPRNRGQSAARNRGVAAAKGEIVAFLDSDCIAQPDWLQELVPYFQDPRVALVGGYVDGYYRKKRMDRYEQVCSALNMGDDTVMGRGKNCVFYVPTCNMLVRKTFYLQAGGLDENLRVGEDVDLCWRLMAAGHHLFYIPRGAVRHKHRNRLLAGYLRRFEYGTSEAALYARFPAVIKQLPWQPAGLGAILCVVMTLVTRSWIGLMLLAGIVAIETGCKRMQLIRKMTIRLPWKDVFTAVIKDHFQLAFYLAYILVRYHLLLLIVLAFAVPSQLALWLTIIIFPTLVTYIRKRPRLSFPTFAFFYLGEHAFYQCGAFWGCLEQKRFRLYRISFRYAGFIKPSRRRGKKNPMPVKKASENVAMG